MNRILSLLTTIIIVIITINTYAKDNISVDSYGVVRSFPDCDKDIFLILSADSTFEGSDTILNILDKHKINASFFVTGNCLRMREHQATIQRIISRGDYLGAHSDKHILYADWSNERNSLVTKDSLQNDIKANYRELEKFGITFSDAPYYLPPYEWYAGVHTSAIRELGIIPINFSQGLTTSNDYTTPDMNNYCDSERLIQELFQYEATHTLNGAIVLIHPGTSPTRTDKLYHHLDDIITQLTSLGYTFNRL